jgi:hypothetical protein
VSHNPASEGKFGSCVLCGVGRLEKVVLEIRQPDRFERAAGIKEAECHRSWVRCEHCGGLTNVRRDGCEVAIAAMAKSYYAIDFADTSLETRFHNVLDLTDGKSDNRQRVHRVRKYAESWFGGASIPGSLRLLDIGAGLGVFLHAFLEENPCWLGRALEPDPTAAQHLRKVAEGRFTILESTLEDLQESPTVYHLCSLNKVLEHIASPLEFLCRVVRLIDVCSGLLYVEVPDYWTVGNRDSSDNILGALHYHLYGIRSLSILLQRVGFVPLKIERFKEPSGKISVYAFAAHPEATKLFINRKNGDASDVPEEIQS